VERDRQSHDDRQRDSGSGVRPGMIRVFWRADTIFFK